ncbi:hypothetical protein BH10PSE17_BH10PSE17_31660 [soil metagenome]
MARKIEKLTTVAINRAKPGRYYGDGAGLYLQVGPAGNKCWVFRYTSPVTQKVREYGLGALHTYSLAEARQRAKDARQQVDAKIDPIEQKAALATAQRLANKTIRGSEEAVVFHDRITAAVLAGDANLAERELRAHIRQVKGFIDRLAEIYPAYVS